MKSYETCLANAERPCLTSHEEMNLLALDTSHLYLSHKCLLVAPAKYSELI